MTTMLTIIGKSTHFLEKKGVPHARRMAEEVISDALGLKRLDLYLQFDRPLNETELAICREKLTMRGQRIPNAYIQGWVEFASLKLKITPDVLIPRQETELLIEMIAKEPLEGRLFEPCTGSGAIAIALKSRFPHLEVFASDLCPKALAIARENAKAANVEITFLEGDFLEPFAGKCDYLVCNPPYVAEGEYAHLEPEVKCEPKMALVSGPTGLEFYQRFSLRDVVAKKAWFEIGASQGEAMKEIFKNERCKLLQDWSGRDRFFFLEIE